MRARIAVILLVLAAIGASGVPAAAADTTPTPQAGVLSPVPSTGGPTPGPADTSSPSATASPAPSDSAVPQPSDPPAPTPTLTPSGPPEPAPTATSRSAAAAAPTSPAAAAAIRDPRASIGEVDCTDLSLAVTLDNSRSSETVTFLVSISDFVGDEPSSPSFAVAAGETKVEQLPVPDHTGLQVFVADEELWTASEGEQGELTEKVVSVSCAPNARGALATIGELDCAALTVAVNLDNTRATQATTFEVTAQEVSVDAALFDQIFVVAAGASQVVQVPVRDHTTVYVSASDNGVAQDQAGHLLAEDAIDVACTPEPTSDARASFGHLNCAALTLPVTLDNTRSSRDTTFVVNAVDLDSEGPPVVTTVELGAGLQRVVQVPMVNHTDIGIFVLDDRPPPGEGPEDVLLSKDLLTVDCVPPAPRPTPQVSVLAEASALPATGGGGPRLTLLGLLLLTAGAGLCLLDRRVRPDRSCTRGRTAGPQHTRGRQPVRSTLAPGEIR